MCQVSASYGRTALPLLSGRLLSRPQQAGHASEGMQRSVRATNKLLTRFRFMIIGLTLLSQLGFCPSLTLLNRFSTIRTDRNPTPPLVQMLTIGTCPPARRHRHRRCRRHRSPALSACPSARSAASATAGRSPARPLCRRRQCHRRGRYK